jgi:hypothetical protein
MNQNTIFKTSQLHFKSSILPSLTFLKSHLYFYWLKLIKNAKFYTFCSSMNFILVFQLTSYYAIFMKISHSLRNNTSFLNIRILLIHNPTHLRTTRLLTLLRNDFWLWEIALFLGRFWQEVGEISASILLSCIVNL